MLKTKGDNQIIILAMLGFIFCLFTSYYIWTSSSTI